MINKYPIGLILSILFFFEISNCNTIIAKPKIIIKFDDLSALNGTCTGKLVLDYLTKKKIKFSYGVIANQLDNSSLNTLSPYINAKDNNGERLLEIFNHGLDHTCNEFSGTSFNYQKTHLEKATQIVNKYLGIQMHTFGAPCNANDSITNQVVSDNPNYSVFFQNNFKDTIHKNILFLTWPDVQFESVIGNPNFDFFVKNFNSVLKYSTNFMILTGHPNNWTQSQLAQFKLIIDFLVERNYEFILPSDYYHSLNLYPFYLDIVESSNKEIKLSWNDNDTSSNYYKIERSVNNSIWDEIGTCQDCNSHIDKDIIPDSKLYYRVYKKGKLKSGYSNEVLADMSVTNVNVIPNNSNFEISSSIIGKTILKLNMTKSGKVSFYIYDVNGKLQKILLSSQLPIGYYQFSYDFSDLKTGVYFCYLRTPIDYATKKIIISNN